MLSGSPARPTHHESVLAFLPAVFRWDLKWLLTTVPYAATIIQSELAQKIKPIYYLCSREIHEPSSRLCLERGSLWFWPFFWGQRKGAINVRVGPEANENMCISSPLWTQAALGAMRRRQESIISRPPALVLYLHTVGSDMVLCQLDIFAPLSAFCCMSHWILSASCFLWTATEKSPSLKKIQKIQLTLPSPRNDWPTVVTEPTLAPYFSGYVLQSLESILLSCVFSISEPHIL